MNYNYEIENGALNIYISELEKFVREKTILLNVNYPKPNILEYYLGDKFQPIENILNRDFETFTIREELTKHLERLSTIIEFEYMKNVIEKDIIIDILNDDYIHSFLYINETLKPIEQ